MPEEVTRNKFCEVRGSSIHEKGVFALRDISEDVKIVEYVGERISKDEAESRGHELAEKSKKTGGASVYIFTLNKKFDLDGDIPENMARFINHSCEPNCEAQIHKNRIWIRSIDDIKEGDELTFDYGFDLEHYEDHPCRCGKDQCVGYIVGRDYWKQLRKRLKKKKAKKRDKAENKKSGGKKKDKKKKKSKSKKDK